MPAFSGVVSASSIYGATSGLAGGAFDSRAASLYPYTSAYLAAGEPSGAVTTHLPISVANGAYGGAVAGSFALSDWYNRMHMTPTLLALGNLVTGLSKTFKVWNAWLAQSQTLNTITAANASGITLTNPSALPITFTPNQELTWTAAISTQGSPVINATYTFAFADGETQVLAITGQRISAWALTPDWATPVSERFDFKTSVLQAWSGAEMRRALRIAPRRIFTFDVQLNAREKRYIESQLFAWSSQVWALPIWPDGQYTTAQIAQGALTIACDTVNRDFVNNGLAILIKDASVYEVVQVTSFTATTLTLTNPTQNAWPANTKLYPVRAARLTSYPKLARFNGAFATARPSFLVIDSSDWAAASGLAQYRTAPVLENSPDEGAGLELTYERETVTIDGETNAISLDDRAGMGFPTNTHSWFLQGRTARANFRALLYLLKGRQGEIWVPTYQSDLKQAAVVSSAALTIDVETCGYTLYLQNQQGRQDIRIELLNGTIFYRRVTGSIVVDANTERLSIDSSLGQQVNTTDVRRISFMTLCRLSSDAIEMLHHNAADGLATAVTPWRAVNHAL